MEGQREPQSMLCAAAGKNKKSKWIQVLDGVLASIQTTNLCGLAIPVSQ